MINELSLVPFNKLHCIAMLNTLFPPFQLTLSTTRLPAERMERQRNEHLQVVLSSDRRVPFRYWDSSEEGIVENAKIEWASIVRQLETYLQLTSELVNMD
jgi:hypothetical protein